MSTLNKNVESKWSVSALLVSIGASLCCTLPILATFFGFSLFAGASAFFESFRPYLLTGTFLLLGFSYYQMFKKPKQAEIDCECDDDTLRKNKTMKYLLHFVTLATLFFAFFPQIINSNSNDGFAASTVKVQKIAIMDIGGMTCEGCAIGVHNAVTSLEGVVKADVSLDTKIAIVYLAENASVKEADMRKVITNVGFTVESFEWKGQ